MNENVQKEEWDWTTSNEHVFHSFIICDFNVLYFCHWTKQFSQLGTYLH